MNKFLSKVLFFCLFTFVLTACPEEHFQHSSTFPDIPVNFGDINSIYDDYNSASPVIGQTSPLCFSSNRLSSGNNFSIIYKLLDIFIDRSSGNLTVDENTSGNLDVFIRNEYIYTAVNKINDQSNELGPYLIPQGEGIRKVRNSDTYMNLYILLYASDASGNLDIKFTEGITEPDYTSPRDIVFLNSDKDDAYPTLNRDSSMVYFCSNRDGNFNIYRTDLDRTGNLVEAFSDSSAHTITMVPELSSQANDKCPFIIGNLMVFTSNRSGGYGSFDLYYSKFENGDWSAPVNFGDKINTEYDEYRPIVKYFWEVSNDFMIFSSNRPGGKGGFDLYYVGIDKMTGIYTY